MGGFGTMARPWFILLVALLALLLAAGPVAGQAEGATDAWAEPRVTVPGGQLTLLFQVENPEPVDVAVQEEVRCTITGPQGETTQPCEEQEGVATVRTSGSGTRTYGFPHVAAADLGTYTVVFETDATLRLPIGEATAETTFTVVDPAQLPDAGGPGGGGPGDGPGDDGPGDEPEDAGPGDSGDGDEPLTPGGGGQPGAQEAGDAGRLLASTGIGIAAVSAALVGNRFDLGGGT